jgi:hypothetical protein
MRGNEERGKQNKEPAWAFLFAFLEDSPLLLTSECLLLTLFPLPHEFPFRLFAFLSAPFLKACQVFSFFPL